MLLFSHSVRTLLVAAAFGVAAGSAEARPPLVTWDWYHAAETYMRYGTPDARISAKYFRMAADRDNDAAQYKLGEYYEKGIGVSRSDAEAFKWYRRAAQADNPYAQVKLGEFFRNGRGVPRDEPAAAKWYERAARQGNPWAFQGLAFMLADGAGIGKDVDRSRRYFELAIRETDDHWSKWKLAELLRDSDPPRARRLLLEAARQGNPKAAAEIAALR